MMDYVERGHMMGAKPPKHMCIECFRIFSIRNEDGGRTEKCTCGNKELVRLDPSVPVPRRKANKRTWKEFFKRNFMSKQAELHFLKFKSLKEI